MFAQGVNKQIGEGSEYVERLWDGLGQGLANFFCQGPDFEGYNYTNLQIAWKWPLMIATNDCDSLLKLYFQNRLWARFGLWAAVCHLLGRDIIFGLVFLVLIIPLLSTSPPAASASHSELNINDLKSIVTHYYLGLYLLIVQNFHVF